MFLDVDNAVVNEGVMFIASQYAVCPGSEDKALVLYDQLDTYNAAYNTSQVMRFLVYLLFMQNFACHFLCLIECMHPSVLYI